MQARDRLWKAVMDVSANGPPAADVSIAVNAADLLHTLRELNALDETVLRIRRVIEIYIPKSRGGL